MLIRLTEASVTIGRRRVLDGVSATIRAGETTAVRGPSGAGKSTLLGVLAGLVPLYAGSVAWDPVVDPHIEWLVQSTPLLGRRSVLDNATLSAMARGGDLGAVRTRAEAALQSVGLAGRGADRAFTLSGGEKQRVALARAIVARAAVVLADEPTASLDADTRSIVVDSLQAAANDGALVVIATHDEFVANRCDRRLFLDSGALREDFRG